MPHTFQYGPSGIESISRVDHAPITFLYEGHTTGGTTASTMKKGGSYNLRTTNEFQTARREDRMEPPLFDRHPEMLAHFDHLIKKCCATQKGTRKLHARLLKQEAQLAKNTEFLEHKLKIMRSMPDISMPRREFSLFVGNAMEQQQAMDREMSEELDHFLAGNRVASIRHIFPLRGPNGRIADNNQANLQWRYSNVPPDNMLGRNPGAKSMHETM